MAVVAGGACIERNLFLDCGRGGLASGVSSSGEGGVLETMDEDEEEATLEDRFAGRLADLLLGTRGGADSWCGVGLGVGRSISGSLGEGGALESVEENGLGASREPIIS